MFILTIDCPETRTKTIYVCSGEILKLWDDSFSYNFSITKNQQKHLYTNQNFIKSVYRLKQNWDRKQRKTERITKALYRGSWKFHVYCNNFISSSEISVLEMQFSTLQNKHVRHSYTQCCSETGFIPWMIKTEIRRLKNVKLIRNSDDVSLISLRRICDVGDAYSGLVIWDSMRPS